MASTARLTVLSEGLKTACSQCNLQELCLPIGLSNNDLAQLDELVSVRKRLKRHQHLYRTGDPFEAIYAVRAGSFKTSIVQEDGREQVTGFQMTSEILGLDGISAETHTCDAEALADSPLLSIQASFSISPALPPLNLNER